MKLLNIVPVVSFVLLLVLLIGKIAVLKNRGIRVNSKTKKTVLQKTFLYPVFVLVAVLFIVETFRITFPFSFSILPNRLIVPLIQSSQLQTTGAVVQLFALVFLLVTFIHFKDSFRFGMNSENHGKLLTNGVFSVSRNPFFVSLLIYFIGCSLFTPSCFFIGFTLAAFVGIHFSILKEEKFMFENYGEEYRDYAAKVRRYF